MTCHCGAEVRCGKRGGEVANTEIKSFNSAVWLLLPAGFTAIQARGAILPPFFNKTQEEALTDQGGIQGVDSSHNG